MSDDTAEIALSDLPSAWPYQFCLSCKEITQHQVTATVRPRIWFCNECGVEPPFPPGQNG